METDHYQLSILHCQLNKFHDDHLVLVARGAVLVRVGAGLDASLYLMQEVPVVLGAGASPVISA